MNIRGALSSIRSSAKRLFSFVGRSASSAARQAVRFLLFFEARRRRKHPEKDKDGAIKRLISWSEEWEPEDPQEREALFYERWYRLITFLWITGLASLMVLLFGNPIPRAGNSFKYLGESWSFIFQYLILGNDEAPAPSMSNESSADYGWVLDTIKSAWFYFQAGISSMTNPHVLEEWAATTANKAIDVIKFATWVPIVVIALKIGFMQMVSPHKGDDGESTPALKWWDEVFVPKVLRPMSNRVRDYFSWCSANGGRIKGAVLALAAVLCVFGWTVLDFVTSYFTMLMTFTFGWFPAFGASVAVDVVNVAARLGIPGLAAFLVIGAYKANVRAGLGELRAMQAENEAVASSLPVVTAINGPVGVGKTTMVSSVATDAESYFRNYYLSVMMKYHSAFPKFPWEKLEAWVRAKCDPRNDKGSRLETRAKIKEGIKALWAAWIENDLMADLPNGNEAFFGYDPEFGLRFFDGAKEVSLIDGVLAYAESYFMYFSGKKLVTSNYPIAMDDGAGGLFFPVYAPASAYLSRGCRPPRGEKTYSTIFNEDFFRIKNAVDPDDGSKDASIDGGVIAMTEGSNERGNRFDYSGMSRKDEKANKVNDGWNQAMRLIRHWFTVDEKPVVNFIYDYQRGDAMNADQRDAAEDTAFIMERSDEQNALPWWWFLDYVTQWVEIKWQNYFWYSWRPNRSKNTLLNRFLSRLAGSFINLRQRLRYSYGYEVVAFNREHGGGNGLTGQRTTEQYFFLYRKVRGELFNSGVYAPILEQRSISATSGWLDMPTFTSTEATPKEFDRENSFFIKDISALFDPSSAIKASRRIWKNAQEGTSIWSDGEGEEEPDGSHPEPQ